MSDLVRLVADNLDMFMISLAIGCIFGLAVRVVKGK